MLFRSLCSDEIFGSQILFTAEQKETDLPELVAIAEETSMQEGNKKKKVKLLSFSLKSSRSLTGFLYYCDVLEIKKVVKEVIIVKIKKVL